MRRTSGLLVALATVLAPPAILDAQGLIEIPSGNLTIVAIDPTPVGPLLTFSLAFAHPTGQPQVPDLVQISFGNLAGPRGYGFEQSRSLTFLIDQSTELPIGLMEYDEVNHMVRRFVPLAIFDRLAAATSISGQVGHAAFQFDPAAMQAVRTLATRIRKGE
jgi:hypothetical protein